MSVAEDQWSGPAVRAVPATFDRQPPQDLLAEQSVLGGMLMSKDAIADVAEVLRSADFYKPAHSLIFDAIVDLFTRGEPADTVTVAAELDRSRTLPRIGGAVYLHNLLAAVPTAANAAYYAQIVAEKAILRRLVEAGTRIVQLGYGGNDGDVGGGEVDQIVDRAQAEIYEVSERRTSEDYVVLEDLLQPTMDEIDAIAMAGGRAAGVPTGFADLDSLTNGLHPGQMIIVAARPGVGKALALDTPLITPTGWTTMGGVRVGDRLVGHDGRPVTVVAATEVMAGRPCFRVEFAGGESIIADAGHEWPTWEVAAPPGDRGSVPGAGSRPSRRTTAELRQRLTGAGSPTDVVAGCAPVVRAPAHLPVDPWVLGFVLASTGSPTDTDLARPAGTLACREADRDLVMKEFERLGYPAAPGRRPDAFEVPGLPDGCTALRSDRTRHVPMAYLAASIEQRLALAQGIVDAAGRVDSEGRFRVPATSPGLARDVAELLAGLGCVVWRTDPLSTEADTAADASEPTRPEHAPELIVATARPLARLPRLLVDARTDWTTEETGHRIVGVHPIPSVPVRCVQVDSADHLYLAGRAMVPTHNSTLALDVARHAAVKHRQAAVIFSLEMSKSEITMRLLSAEAGIRLSHMRAGSMSEQDWEKIVRRMTEISDAPLFIDDSPNMTMMEIRAKARRLKQRNNLRLVVVDYLQLMTSGKRVESRQQEVSEFSRQMKLLAKELEVPVIAISQLNRGPEQRTDKRPMLSDLRESGSLEQDADMVILVHRPDAWEADDPRAGEADLIVAKHRNGPTATVAVAHQLHYSRFADLAT